MDGDIPDDIENSPDDLPPLDDVSRESGTSNSVFISFNLKGYSYMLRILDINFLQFNFLLYNSMKTMMRVTVLRVYRDPMKRSIRLQIFNVCFLILIYLKSISWGSLCGVQCESEEQLKIHTILHEPTEIDDTNNNVINILNLTIYKIGLKGKTFWVFVLYRLSWF